MQRQEPRATNDRVKIRSNDSLAVLRGFVARDSVDRNLIISNIVVRDDRALGNVAT